MDPKKISYIVKLIASKTVMNTANKWENVGEGKEAYKDHEENAKKEKSKKEEEENQNQLLYLPWRL